jgi:hypothetical protein
MSAYQRARWADALGYLERWAQESPPAEDDSFRALARTAVLRLPPLVEGPGRAELTRRAQALAKQLERREDPSPSI